MVNQWIHRRHPLRMTAGCNEYLVLELRGLGNPAIVREAREFASKYAPAVLCLVETQIQKSRAELLRSSFGYKYAFAVGSSGRSGGIVIFWNNDEVDLEVVDHSKYYVDAVVANLGSAPWRLTCVYGEA